MLRDLRVRNFAVLETVDVSLEPGLNVLTGETGAGKSLLIDALLLIRGARAQGDVIRTDAETATVEAVFEVEARGPVAALLAEAGLALDDGRLVLRRELSRTGRHRAFANDSPVTVGLLERLGDHLVEVHGQHEHQRLLEPARQLELLDRFAGAEEVAAQVADLFAKFSDAGRTVERSRLAAREGAQREELLRFQVGEIDAARLRPGEEAELRLERRRLQNAERLSLGLGEVAALLDEDRDAATARLARAARVLGDLSRIDPALGEPLGALDAAHVQLEDALATLRRLRSTAVGEPGQLEAVDARLDALSRLRRKYGDTEEAILAFRREAASELETLERHEETVATQQQTLSALRSDLAAAATDLAERRQAAAGRLGVRVERELRALGMERASFRVAVTRGAFEDVGPRGLDRAEFLLSTNPGEEVRPLARIASGGELSRAMLALTAVLAREDRIPTVVFDEVDAGIGGRVATVVAQKLADAAEGRQVLCVTHLAPIAAAAHRHVRVVKTSRGGRTRVLAEPLGGGERVEEIARMLGGEAVTGAARAHALELLAPSGSGRRRGERRHSV